MPDSGTGVGRRHRQHRRIRPFASKSPRPARRGAWLCCPRRDDKCFRQAVLVLGPDKKGPAAQINLGDRFSLDPGPIAEGLFSHLLHELRATDPSGKPGEVFDVRRRGQLTTGSDSPRHKALEHQWLKVGAGGINGRRMPCGARADDHNLLDLHGTGH